jgi:hypothetical protein
MVCWTGLGRLWGKDSTQKGFRVVRGAVWTILDRPIQIDRCSSTELGLDTMHDYTSFLVICVLCQVANPVFVYHLMVWTVLLKPVSTL